MIKTRPTRRAKIDTETPIDFEIVVQDPDKPELYVGPKHNDNAGSKHFLHFALCRIASDTNDSHMKRYGDSVRNLCMWDEEYKQEIISLNDNILTCACSPGLRCHAQILQAVAREQAGMTV